MKVLGIDGSPRRGGNTETLLDRALEGAKSEGALVEKVVLNALTFSPCQECENVRDDGTCIVEDQLQPLYRKVGDADAVIVASPIFFGSVSAQTKMMVDRFQCAWRARFILKKNIYKKKRRGAFLSVQATDRQDFFNNAKHIIKNLFAVINAEYKEELFCHGVDEKGAVLKRKDILDAAYNLGQQIAKT